MITIICFHYLFEFLFQLLRLGWLLISLFITLSLTSVCICCVPFRLLYYAVLHIIFLFKISDQVAWFWMLCHAGCMWTNWNLWLTGTAELDILPPPVGDFGISQDQLSTITRDHNHNALEEIGGVSLPQVFLIDFMYCFTVLILHSFSCYIYAPGKRSCRCLKN